MQIKNGINIILFFEHIWLLLDLTWDIIVVYLLIRGYNTVVNQNWPKFRERIKQMNEPILRVIYDENCIRHTHSLFMCLYCKLFDWPFHHTNNISLCSSSRRKRKNRICLTCENWFILIIISSHVNTRIRPKNELTSAGFFSISTFYNIYNNIKLMIYTRRYA